MDHSLFSALGGGMEDFWGGGGKSLGFQSKTKRRSVIANRVWKRDYKKIERQLSANKGGSGIIRIFESLIEDPEIGS